MTSWRPTTILIAASCYAWCCSCQSQEFPVGTLADSMSSGGNNSVGGDAGGGEAGAANEGGSAGAPTCDCSAAGSDCMEGACSTVGGRTQLAVGLEAACAIRAGELWCWGNRYGTDPLEISPLPELLGSGAWSAVSSVAGESYCALDNEQALHCWGGDSGHGNLAGLSTTPAPERVQGSTFAALYYGSGHGCALDTAGKLLCWGRNTDGELGLGDTVDRSAPARVSTQTFHTVAVGWGHTCAITTTGELYCWGRNAEGQLGLGHRDIVLVPTLVDDRAWRSVSAAEFISCAIARSGQLFCWGDNKNGRLGTGDEAARLVPTLILEGPISLASAGRLRTCATDADNVLRCWGLDAELKPSPIEILSTPPLDITELHAGNENSCLLGSGDVYCWGTNVDSALGLGDTTLRTIPTLVELP